MTSAGRKAPLGCEPFKEKKAVQLNFSRLRILVADVASMDARIRAIFTGDDLSFVRTASEVEDALGETSFDLAVVCQRFDESKVLPLLQSIAQTRSSKDLPVACIRAPGATRTSSSPDAFEQSVVGLGARAVVDLRSWPSRQRQEDDRVRRVFYGCIDRRTLMRESTAYTRTLQYASDTLGGREKLAGLLGASLHELGQWMSGAELPPVEAYARALDIVAAGPYAQSHRPATAAGWEDQGA
jgi:hypothetical protein